MRWFLGIVVAIVVMLAIAFLAFRTPDIPRATLEAKYAVAPSQFIVLADGTRAHYRIRGAANAPVLLLLHGSNASLFTWEPWSKRLSNAFRVVSVDLPGHGLTGAVPSHDYSSAGMTKFVTAFADAIGLKTFALAGNSMGGGIAAQFAETYPKRVTALILVDAGGMPMKTGDKIPFAFQLARMSWMKPVILNITPRFLAAEGLNDAIVRKSVLTDAMIDQYWEFAVMEGSREATLERFQSYASGERSFVKQHVSALSMPVLILWGEQDHLIPVAAAHLWHDAVPGSKLIVYPATGHIPMEEVADQSAADVRAFLSAH